jgi:Tol biopolymer transport system component
VLPEGWEPCWTFAEVAGLSPPPGPSDRAGEPDDVAALAAEVRGKGWIAFSAAMDRGDWDLFVMRPDGSQRRALTATRAYHEAGVRFSPDGSKILYYRIPRSDAVDNNTYGTHELVVADADGGHAVVFGRGFAWASWGPDGTQLACLDPRGIQIVDVASRVVVRQVARKGIVQQLVWSPDGKAFAGTANGLGPFWNIGRLDGATGRLDAVSETERYNCTPDWMPDARRILYSRGIIPEAGGWAELWLAEADGPRPRLLYAEPGRHIYGGCASPDGAYLLFTRSEVDLGRVDNSRTSLAIVRRADTPLVRGPGAALRAKYTSARTDPVLDLSWGWEPHWTYAEVPPATARH